jgi:hypothetical protein
LISRTGGTKKETQLIITCKPEEKYTDRMNGPTFISAIWGTKKKIQIQLFNKNKSEEKYKIRLNRPTFDLTYRGHEEGDPAHHDEHG